MGQAGREAQAARPAVKKVRLPRVFLPASLGPQRKNVSSPGTGRPTALSIYSFT
jgi:hypothetical protein